MYSQHEEEREIVNYFAGRTGRFLDLAAHDGRTFSNTLRLAELGWSGVAVEPDPTAFVKLLQECGRFPNVVPVQAAITVEPAGIVPFYVSDGEGVSTVSERWKERWKGAVNYTRIHVATATLPELLEAFPGPYHFISLDVEGLTVPLLKKMPLAGVELLCVEHDGKQHDVLQYCAEAGLGEVLLENAENLILAR